MSKIGLFDSGVGGLNTLRALRTSLPHYDYLYLGDSARAPYGARDQAQIYDYTRECIEYLRQNGCSLVIIACNTASTEALRKLQDEYLPIRDSFRILGILVPVAEHAIQMTQNKKIGVLATVATVTSQKYVRELHKIDQSIDVFQNAAPMLVPYIESGAQSADQLCDLLQTHITPLLQHDIDVLVLGCTHYAHIEHAIRLFIPPHVSLVHDAQCVGDALEKYLKKHATFAEQLSQTNTCSIYTTYSTPTFSRIASLCVPHVHAAEITLT